MRHGRRPTPPSTGVDAGTRRVDLAVLGALTVALRLPAFVAERHLTFDDGVYGASAVAMRAGGQPFRDVFSSQGPLFLPLVWVADLLGPPHHQRAAAAVAARRARSSSAATYVAGRAITDRAGALSPPGW